MKNRCSWCGDNELYINYHDNEWSVPVHNDRILFEFLLLEGMQAGLSWLTILKKRDNFRKAFDGFDPAIIARYNTAKTDDLLTDAGIIRNKLKIAAAVQNAQSFLQIREEFGSFDRYIWQFVDGKPVQNIWKTVSAIPASTKESDEMSKDLKLRGFKFVGTIICYAHMQATGMVNDHVVDCFRYDEIKNW